MFIGAILVVVLFERVRFVSPEELAIRAAEATVAELETGVTSAVVLTGDRPTGQLHLGHRFGTLLNRVRLQDDGVELMVLVADYQTITDRDSPASLPQDVEELVADYLAVGIDPRRATIFAHSQVPELNQLAVPFLSLVTLPELLRNPTVKEEAAASAMTALNGLMLTYPVHQAADILFCQATLVPVGADQLSHVEQTRVIARRFNRRYAPDRPVFPEPEALLSNAPTLLGIEWQEDEQEPRQRNRTRRVRRRHSATAAAGQDGLRPAHHLRAREPSRGRQPRAAHRPLRRHIPGSSEIGSRGAAALKRRATDAVNEWLRPIRARRTELMTHRGHLRRACSTEVPEPRPSPRTP
jgi:tryptophanyl-tRNA synthetase